MTTDDNVNAVALGLSVLVAAVGDVAEGDGVVVLPVRKVAAPPPALDDSNDDVIVLPAVAVAAVRDEESDCDVGAGLSLFTFKAAAAATAAALLKPKLGTNSAAFTFKVENFVAISALS